MIKQAEGKKKDEQIRRTADVVSQIRYLEGKKEHPLVRDPFAYLFVSPEGEQMLAKALSLWPFFAEYLTVREKYFDDQLGTFFQGEQAGQLVILGAGNDMRAERLPFLKDKKIFEVDFPDKIASKQAVLKKALGKIPSHVVYAAADVSVPGFMHALEQQWFITKAKTAFILQGLIYYMSEEGVDSLFTEIKQVFSPGNLLLLDQVTGDLSSTPPHPQEPLSYLSKRGFNVIESALLGDLTAAYFGKSYSPRWLVIAATQ